MLTRQQLIRHEQVRTLYTQSAPALLANVANSLIVDVVLWGTISHRLLLSWNAAMLVVVAARFELRRRYHARGGAAEDASSWAQRFIAGSAAAGSLWGFAAWAFLTPASPLAQTVVL